MTVATNDRRIQYTASAGQTVFPYDFPIEANTEIKVLQTLASDSTTSTLTLTTNYTVSGVGDSGGGNITLVTGAALGDIITITGNTPLTRTTDFNQAGDFLTSELNAQLDRITNILQENDTETSRAVLLADEDTADSLTLPTTSNRASKYLAFDASGNAIASAAQSGVPTSTFMATVLDDETAAAARTTLDCQEDVITTRGDIIRGSSSGAAERLALGTANQYLRSDGTDIAWATPTTPTIQKFTSGSGTYTTPSGVRYIRVRMVGAGGGGAGGGTGGTGGVGSNGGDTTFGTSLLSAGGGFGSAAGASLGGAGGSSSLGTGPIGTALTGSQGSSGAQQASSGTVCSGGSGGASFFGGSGRGGLNNTNGNGAANGSGSGGGGGAATGPGSTVNCAGGGGSGGFVDAVINSPSASYSYSVGAAGAGGSAGTSGTAGGAGGSGYIEVTEFYH